MNTIRVGQTSKRVLAGACIETYFANILVHRFFQRCSKVDVLLVLVHAVILNNVKIAIYHLLEKLHVGAVPVKLIPAVAVAEPKEIAVFHEDHALSGFHVAVVALLNEGGQFLTGLEVIADQFGVVLLAVEVRNIDIFLIR